MHRIIVSDHVVQAADRNTVGGGAHLPDSMPYPTCKSCGSRMVLFLQFDTEKEHDISFQAGSHLLLFMCPQHNDIPEMYADKVELPENFWQVNSEHYSLMLIPPGLPSVQHEQDSLICAKKLDFVETPEQVQHCEYFDYGSHDFKIGGTPGWINYTLDATCPCGGKMCSVCQIPENFPFEKLPSAPEQPDSFSSTDYCLFLGNQIYIFACNKQCNPFAVVALCDN